MAYLMIDCAAQLRGCVPVKCLPTITLANFADAEVPTGVIDGNNKVFTLANAPSPAVSLQVFCGIPPLTYIMRAGGLDFTLAGNVITFTTAPLISSEILAWYRF